jgi:hypothetical protein
MTTVNFDVFRLEQLQGDFAWLIKQKLMEVFARVGQIPSTQASVAASAAP